MIRNNGKWVKHDARLFGTAAELLAHSALAKDSSLPYDFWTQNPFTQESVNNIAVYVAYGTQNGHHVRFGWPPNIVTFDPKFPKTPDMAATCVIRNALDNEQLLRLHGKASQLDNRKEPDFVRDARNYAESYFCIARIHGEQKAKIKNPLHVEFLETAHAVLHQSELVLGRAVASDLDEGLAASCARLRQLNILKPV